MVIKYTSTKGTKSKVSSISDTLVADYSGKKNVEKLFKLQKLKTSGKSNVDKLYELQKIKNK